MCTLSHWSAPNRENGFKLAKKTFTRLAPSNSWAKAAKADASGCSRGQSKTCTSTFCLRHFKTNRFSNLSKSGRVIERHTQQLRWSLTFGLFDMRNTTSQGYLYFLITWSYCTWKIADKAALKGNAYIEQKQTLWLLLDKCWDFFKYNEKNQCNCNICINKSFSFTPCFLYDYKIIYIYFLLLCCRCFTLSAPVKYPRLCHPAHLYWGPCARSLNSGARGLISSDFNL